MSRKTPTIDIVGRVLSPFEKLERELDQKEALQAFVNKAAAALMADEDLSLISDESLSHKDIEMDVEEYVDNKSIELLEQNLMSNSCEVLPNVQIIVPPEEFCNSHVVTEVQSVVSDSCTQQIESKEQLLPQNCLKALESIDQTFTADNDSIENEIELIDKILSEVENEQKSQNLMVSEIENQIERQENMIKPLDTPLVEENVACDQNTTDNQIIPLMEEQIKSEETKPNETNLKNESQNDIKMIDESNKTIEEKVDSVVNTLEEIDSIKTSFESNDNTTDNDFDCDIEKDLFEDIDELNREIEALEELVEYEIKMESLKESRNSKTETNESIVCNITEETVNKSTEETPKRVVERENSVQLQNGNKYSPPMSLIPRRLPSATPRKSISYGNLPALYASFKTPELKKPSLIPRPVYKTNDIKTNGVNNSKNESPVKLIHSQNAIKVQNSKTVQKSKTRILSERKKNEVLNSNSIETKRTVHQRPVKSALKCKSLMDLTTAFSSGKDS